MNEWISERTNSLNFHNCINGNAWCHDVSLTHSLQALFFINIAHPSTFFMHCTYTKFSRSLSRRYNKNFKQTDAVPIRARRWWLVLLKCRKLLEDVTFMVWRFRWCEMRIKLKRLTYKMRYKLHCACALARRHKHYPYHWLRRKIISHFWKRFRIIEFIFPCLCIQAK